jgi:hypothetical protein
MGLVRENFKSENLKYVVKKKMPNKRGGEGVLYIKVAILTML